MARSANCNNGVCTGFCSANHAFSSCSSDHPASPNSFSPTMRELPLSVWKARRNEVCSLNSPGSSFNASIAAKPLVTTSHTSSKKISSNSSSTSGSRTCSTGTGTGTGAGAGAGAGAGVGTAATTGSAAGSSKSKAAGASVVAAASAGLGASKSKSTVKSGAAGASTCGEGVVLGTGSSIDSSITVSE